MLAPLSFNLARPYASASGMPKGLPSIQWPLHVPANHTCHYSLLSNTVLQAKQLPLSPGQLCLLAGVHHDQACGLLLCSHGRRGQGTSSDLYLRIRGKERQRGSSLGWEVVPSFSEHMEYPRQLSSHHYRQGSKALQQVTGL